jgi:hypothetical protein
MSIEATEATTASNPLAGRITCTILEARNATGLSRMTLWRLRKNRKLRSVSVGSRKLIDVKSLLELLAA